MDETGAMELDLITRISDRSKVTHPSEPYVLRKPSEVIIHEQNSVKPLNNRWAFTSNVIDYASVYDWSKPLNIVELSKVRRIKICGLRRVRLAELLPALPSALEQLDIDTFSLFRGKAIRLEFVSLRTLSIEAFKTVEPTETGEDLEIPGGMAIVRLEAPSLREIYLGEHLKPLPDSP